MQELMTWDDFIHSILQSVLLLRIDRHIQVTERTKKDQRTLYSSNIYNYISDVFRTFFDYLDFNTASILDEIYGIQDKYTLHFYEQENVLFNKQFLDLNMSKKAYTLNLWNSIMQIQIASKDYHKCIYFFLVYFRLYLLWSKKTKIIYCSGLFVRWKIYKCCLTGFNDIE